MANSGVYQRGEPEQVMQPIALATGISEGDLTAVVAALAVPAGSFTWTTDLATTRKAFAPAFLGRCANTKRAAENVFGQGGNFKLQVRVDTAGVYRYAVAPGAYALYDLLAPSKASGNALLPQQLEVTTDPSQAIAEVVGLAGVNPGCVDAKLLSALVRQAPRTGNIEVLSFPLDLASIAAATIVTLTPGFAGEILSMDFLVNKPATTAAKLATLTPKIGATALTGGVVSLTSANCTPMGAVAAGTAVTALNVFAAADALNIVASAVTAFVEGSGTLLLKVRNRGAV